jgi:hypothetical protein
MLQHEVQVLVSLYPTSPLQLQASRGMPSTISHLDCRLAAVARVALVARRSFIGGSVLLCLWKPVFWTPVLMFSRRMAKLH